MFFIKRFDSFFIRLRGGQIVLIFFQNNPFIIANSIKATNLFCPF